MALHLRRLDTRQDIEISGADGASWPTRSGTGSAHGSTMASHDGRWLAYLSNKTRREEVCLRRLDGSEGSWQVSTGGGGGIRWGRDGRELFMVVGEILMRVPLEARGDDLSIGQPEMMFEVPPTPTESSFRDYDYDPASDRFLFTRPPRGVAERREIAVSLGWAKRLGEKLGAAGAGGKR